MPRLTLPLRVTGELAGLCCVGRRLRLNERATSLQHVTVPSPVALLSS